MKNNRYIKNVLILFAFIFVLAGVLQYSNHVQAASAKLNKKSATMWVGDTLQLKVSNTKNKVKWSSNKKSVATVSTKGKVKAKKSGKAVITAKVGNKKLKCNITVRKTELSAKTITIAYGKNTPLKLNYPKKKVAWSSSDTRIAYADGKKIYAKSVGDAVITAKCNGKSYTCKIKVVSGETDTLTENGVYTSKEKVALYIHTYNKLPNNFITKDEARALGWPGGSLLSYAPYKCIGGDRYSNYEGTLPKKSGRIYYECDIDTLGALQRGAKRIVYSNDGLIYYTEDHYETFQLLYK